MSDSKAKPEGAEDAAVVSVVAVNGIVDGRRTWIEEEPWYLFDGTFPVRFEDGALDWRRLSESEHEEAVRVGTHMRGLYGIADPAPRVLAPAPDIPCGLGWSMSTSARRALMDRQGRVCEGRLKGYHGVAGKGRFAFGFALGGESWFPPRADGLPRAALRHARRSRVPSVWVDVDMWRYEGGDFLEVGTGVERPEKTDRGWLRIVYIERWPNDEARHGTHPGAGEPREVLTPTCWDGCVWQRNPRWWEGMFPSNESGREIDYRGLAPTQKKTEGAASVYCSVIRLWDEPIVHYTRERQVRWTESIGPSVTLEDLRRHYEPMGLESPY